MLRVYVVSCVSQEEGECSVMEEWRRKTQLRRDLDAEGWGNPRFAQENLAQKQYKCHLQEA